MNKRANIFEFTSFQIDSQKKRVIFNYKTIFRSAEPIFYTETIELTGVPDFNGVPKELLNKILEGVHLMLGISYYKFHCATKVRIPYNLSKQEAEFWNKVYIKGLGEFFYRNKLSPKIFPKFLAKRKVALKGFRIEKNNSYFVAVSGGKDSVVATELLKSLGVDLTAIFIENQKMSFLVDKIIEETGLESIKLRRILDEKVFDQTLKFYDGHIPVSAIYAFLGILSCLLYKKSYFITANEYSSNFGNVKYKSQTINHQWSKSFEFETLFQNYIKEFVTPDVLYFSLLRPFYEIRIAELFCKYKKYFPYFSSCNKNFELSSLNEEKIIDNLWCGKCAKCIFSFLLLSPFLEQEELIKIFGKNLFIDVTLLATLRDILGFGEIKPFDCVGTPDESKVAFYLSRKKFRDDLAGEIFLPKIDPEDNRYFFNEKGLLLKIYFKDKKDPAELIKKVFKMQLSSVPDHLKFLGAKSVILLGFGKEGQTTKKYLEKNFPNLEIGIGDISTDLNYLEKQINYDIAVRSPGIAKEFLKITYTTATNIFFSYVRQLPGVKTIGVTGTKGKSTTAALIFHILKTAGKNVEFLGNIGTPMLGSLLEEVKKDCIFVLELSSYQLDDIRFSPNIAVVTSLFPEHMDYHRNIKNYYTAKKNIFKYQEREDFFIFNPKNKKIYSWLKDVKSTKIPFANTIELSDSDIQLQGEHNKDNIRAAIATVRILNIPEVTITRAIKSFKGLSHRLEFVGEYYGVKFYDDAISTTPESTIFAIKSLPKIGTIFLGGQDRGYSFSKLENVIKKYKINNIVLFPESGNKIIKNRKGLNILETSSMEEAVEFAYKYTIKGEICLLSCASPSYSLWKNFEDKGNQFQSSIKKPLI